MALLDLLGRRWALRVLWELRETGASFRELQSRCGGVSPTVLNDRLHDLRESGIVALGADGYALTTHGRALLTCLGPLDGWAKAWAQRSGRGSASTG